MRGRLSAAALVVTITLLGMLSADATATTRWSAVERLPGRAEALSADGRIAVVASTRSGLRVRLRDTGGRWSSAEDAGIRGGETVGWVRQTWDARGRLIVIWNRDGLWSAVRSRAVSWRRPRRIVDEPTAILDISHEFAADGRGRAVVVWRTEAAIMAVVRDAAGRWSRPRPIVPARSTLDDIWEVKATFAGRGTAHVVTVAPSCLECKQAARGPRLVTHRARSRTWTSPVDLGPGRASELRLAANASGVVVATWIRPIEDGLINDVRGSYHTGHAYAAVVDATGRVSVQERLGSRGAEVHHPHPVLLDSGAAWLFYGVESSGDLYAAFRPPGGGSKATGRVPVIGGWIEAAGVADGRVVAVTSSQQLLERDVGGRLTSRKLDAGEASDAVSDATVLVSGRTVAIAWDEQSFETFQDGYESVNQGSYLLVGR